MTKLIEVVKKKNKGGVNIKPFQVNINNDWITSYSYRFNVLSDEEHFSNIESFEHYCAVTEFGLFCGPLPIKSMC